MTPPTANDLDNGTCSPVPEPEDGVDVANDEQDQKWLTVRRRCELCKQRKVRLSRIPANFKLARL
jgi:hypothetical protein